MNEQLKQAYLETDYKVFNPSLIIKIGKHNTTLDNLLVINGKIEWAYITPYNPFSKLLSEAENDQRFEELKNKIANYIFFEGEGVGTDSLWKPERSFLIIGITKANAIEIGNEYEQNAILYGTLYQQPELLFLNNM